MNRNLEIRDVVFLSTAVINRIKELHSNWEGCVCFYGHLGQELLQKYENQIVRYRTNGASEYGENFDSLEKKLKDLANDINAFKPKQGDAAHNEQILGLLADFDSTLMEQLMMCLTHVDPKKIDVESLSPSSSSPPSD